MVPVRRRSQEGLRSFRAVPTCAAAQSGADCSWTAGVAAKVEARRATRRLRSHLTRS